MAAGREVRKKQAGAHQRQQRPKIQRAVEHRQERHLGAFLVANENAAPKFTQPPRMT